MDIKRTYLRCLIEDVDQNLARFDERTGRFMTGDGWAVTNQDIVYPLALLYSTQDAENPYYHSDTILEHTLRGADAWRDFQYPDGRVEFVKVDGSKWGPIYMPWSMYHWLETYAMVRDILDPERKARWEEGLTLAYSGIAKGLEAEHVHNIPTWDGMATFRAGQILNRPAWLERGRRTIELAVEAQTPQGYWREHHGPTTLYNYVYVHAIGLYHFFSGDERVLPCLERATQFHIRYTYPDGRVVETIDGRVKYHDRISDLAHATFSLFPEGRRYVRLLVANMVRQRQTHAAPVISHVERDGETKISGANYGLSARLASAYAHYCPGPEAAIPQDRDEYASHDPGHALLRRQDGWFYCLSGIVTPPVETRWGQDRQNFVSIWHQHTGLIVGGGNSKDQPDWSTFTVGQEPDVIYLPTAARLEQGEAVDTVSLDYGRHTCTLDVQVVSGKRLELSMGGPAGTPSTAQLLLRLERGHRMTTELGDAFALDEKPVVLRAPSAGIWIACKGWRFWMPPGSRLTWPIMPFNPYAADGAAPQDEGKAVLSISLHGNPTHVILETT